MTVEFIGTAAGEVWKALNEGDVLSTKQIKKITKLKDKEIFAAIGWLAREGKVSVQPTEDEKDILVALI
jgi:hypothetical protein